MLNLEILLVRIKFALSNTSHRQAMRHQVQEGKGPLFQSKSKNLQGVERLISLGAYMSTGGVSMRSHFFPMKVCTRSFVAPALDV